MHWMDDWWGHMGMMWIWVVVGLLLVVLVAYLARGAFFGPPPRRESEDDPESILKRRYARGEIDEEELRRRMDELHAAR